MFEQFVGTKPVEERHRIDTGALEKYLSFRLARLEQFKGGQSNPTYLLTAADGRRFVLRRKPPGKLLPSAHAVDREFRVIPAMNDLIAWLPKNIPPETGTTVVHGDYRLDNVIYHRAEPRILAVLDWELSTLGEPLADFAYHCMSWHIPPGQFRGIGGLDLAALGIPSEGEYIRMYCQRTART